MFKKILIATRGEIALRIHRACREIGVKTVAVHSVADANAMHVRMADEAVCIGPAVAKESYLNKAAIISAALITDADAIHPGYGFLSENADFAEMVKEHGMTFIGPEAKMINLMGNKIEAKKMMKDAGIPILPGSDGDVNTLDEALKIADSIGYPVIIKAVSGGGGKGMKVVRSRQEMPEVFGMARKEAEAAFGDGSVYIEKFLENPRHIEFQVIADNQGNVIHLGDRDCSLQRNNQKVLEETPSPVISDELRDKMGGLVCDAIRKIGYTNVGTIEFLYENGQFYFIEMNTRLQVEHPVTEMITGIDIVTQQIYIAAGEPLIYKQKDVVFRGHAIECRINAEDPETFIPSPGKVGLWHVPGGQWVRVDSGVYSGYTIPPNYDSLIAKLIVFGSTRRSCLMRMRRSLEEFVIEGVKSTISLQQRIIDSKDFIEGKYNIHWLEKFIGKYPKD